VTKQKSTVGDQWRTWTSLAHKAMRPLHRRFVESVGGESEFTNGYTWGFVAGFKAAMRRAAKREGQT
jgi:hypothetical protein